MARKKSESSKATGPKRPGEREAPRRTCAYARRWPTQSCSNEALHELLKIGREQYGIDLLKSWRQAVDNLRLRHPKESIGSLSGLFGKTREGYYSVSKEKRMRRELSERDT